MRVEIEYSNLVKMELKAMTGYERLAIVIFYFAVYNVISWSILYLSGYVNRSKAGLADIVFSWLLGLPVSAVVLLLLHICYLVVLWILAGFNSN